MNRNLENYYNKLSDEQKKVIDNFMNLTEEQSDDKEEDCHNIRKSLLKSYNLNDPWPGLNSPGRSPKAKDCQHFRRYLYLKKGKDEWHGALDSPWYNPGWMRRKKLRVSRKVAQEKKAKKKAKWARRKEWWAGLLPGRKGKNPAAAENVTSAEDVKVILGGGKPKRKYKRRRTRKKRRTKKRKTKRKR